MMSFARIWNSSDLRCLTFRRRFGAFVKSRDCDSRTTPESCPPPNDDSCDDPCPPCPSPRQHPPCPPPEPPTYHPHAGNVGNSFARISNFPDKFAIRRTRNPAARQDLDGLILELRTMIYRNLSEDVYRKAREKNRVMYHPEKMGLRVYRRLL